MSLSKENEANKFDLSLMNQENSKSEKENKDNFENYNNFSYDYSSSDANQYEMDEDDITIQQLTNELQQLQTLLAQYQADQQKKHEHNLFVASSLTSLVNDFFNKCDNLSKFLEMKSKEIDQDFENLSKDKKTLNKNKIHDLRRKIRQIETNFQSNSLDDIKSFGDEIIISFEHIDEEVIALLTDLIKKIDPNSTGLIPNNLVVKLQISKSISKLKRSLSSYLIIWNEKCDELESLIPQPIHPKILPKEIVKPNNNFILEKTPVLKDYINDPKEELRQKNQKLEILNDDNHGNFKPLDNEEDEILAPSPDFITDDNFDFQNKNNFDLINKRIDNLTLEIEVLKEKLEKESSDLERIVENRDSKWQIFFENERVKYEKLLSDIRIKYESLLNDKRNKLVDEITNKIELKTSEILENDSEVTEENLNNIYNDIAVKEKNNFTNIVSQEQKNFEQLLEDERKRFEAIIALKAKEFSQEKEYLVNEKNTSLQNLEKRMLELKKERDNLLEEKNSLIIDLQNITNKTIKNNNEQTLDIDHNDNGLDHDLNFNRYEFNKLNELRAKKIEEEIEKAEEAQVKAQKIYNDFENQRFNLQQQLKTINERNSIENLTQEITKKIAVKFEEELQKIKNQQNSAAPNFYNNFSHPSNANQQNFKQDFLPNINEQPNPAQNFQPIAPFYSQNQEPQNIELNNQQPFYFQPLDQVNPVGFNNLQMQNQFSNQQQDINFVGNNNPNQEFAVKNEEQIKNSESQEKPILRKAKFLKTNNGNRGRLTSEEIRKYANAIISANRRKQSAVS